MDALTKRETIISAPTVFFIIVTYNGEKYIKRCLDSILNQSDGIIVVDNHSNDTTVALIETDYPDIYLRKLDNNVGFGKANNIGINLALERGAEFCMLLNQDVYFQDNTLSLLVNLGKNDKSIGIVSPLHLNGSGELLDFHFYTYLTSEKFHNFWSNLVIRNACPSSMEVNFVNAAAWLVSRNCIESVGGFDSLFNHYGEDVDYVNRIKYKGFKIVLSPAAHAFHDRGYYNAYHYYSDYKKGTISHFIFLKDINRKFLFSIVTLYKFFLTETFRYILDLNIKGVYTILKIAITMSLSLNKIRKHRKISKGLHSFLNETRFPNEHS